MPSLADDLTGAVQAALAAGFAALGVLGIVLMAPSAKRMKATGGPGIVALELAGSDDEVAGILERWGEEGRAAAAQNLVADVPFLVGYGGLLAVLASSGADTLEAKTWAWVGAASLGVAVLAIVAAAFDLVENAFLWRVVKSSGNPQPAARIAQVAALVKWALVLGALAWLLLVVVPILLVPAGVG